MHTDKKAITGGGNAPRERELREQLERYYAQELRLRETLKQIAAQRDELLAAIMELRRAWIAPHRFNLKAAEAKLVDLSEKAEGRAQ